MTPAATRRHQGARALGIFGDSVTTDHISPAGAIKENSPAGKWLIEHGVTKADFNSYGSRRGNHEVMMRGTFANVRIKNLMLPPRADGTREEGGVTLFQPSGEKMFIYDAAMKYIAQGTPTVVFGGEEYGTGLVARLGGEGHAAARREGGDREELRAHPSLEPGRHGRAAAAVQGQRLPCSRSASPATRRSTSPAPKRHPAAAGPDARRSTARTARRRTCRCCCRIDTPIEVDYYNGRRHPAVRAAGLVRRRLRPVGGEACASQNSGDIAGVGRESRVDAISASLSRRGFIWGVVTALSQMKARWVKMAVARRSGTRRTAGSDRDWLGGDVAITTTATDVLIRSGCEGVPFSVVASGLSGGSGAWIEGSFL